MRRTWDALAAGETAVYVGDPATGASELAGLFGRLDGDPRGGTCLEVGCGPGRMTGALAASSSNGTSSSRSSPSDGLEKAP